MLLPDFYSISIYNSENRILNSHHSTANCIMYIQILKCTRNLLVPVYTDLFIGFSACIKGSENDSVFTHSLKCVETVGGFDGGGVFYLS